MSKLSVQVEVSKEIYEVSEAVIGLIASIKEKAKDGLSMGEVAAAVAENIGKIMDGVAGLDQVPAEYKEDPAATAMAGAVLGGKLMGVFLPKPVV